MTSLSSEVQDTVTRIVAEVCLIPPDAITLDAKIVDLSEDSIKLFELLLAFEKHYGIEADYEVVMQLETIADIVSYISRTIIV